MFNNEYEIKKEGRGTPKPSSQEQYLPSFFLQKRATSYKYGSNYATLAHSQSKTDLRESPSREDLPPRESSLFQDFEDDHTAKSTGFSWKEPNSIIGGASASIERNVESDNWVTVFGFPSEISPQVLEYFVGLGQVVAQEMSKEVNFVNIKYASVWDARKALSKNGFLIDGIHMIGVMPIRTTNTTLGITKSPFQSSESLREGIVSVEPQVAELNDEVGDVFLSSSVKSKPSIVVVDEGEYLTRKSSLYERIINFFIN